MIFPLKEIHLKILYRLYHKINIKYIVNNLGTPLLNIDNRLPYEGNN